MRHSGHPRRRRLGPGERRNDGDPMKTILSGARRPSLPVLLLLLAGCAHGGGAPGVGAPGAAPPEYSIEEFLGTTSIRGASFSPDGGAILFSSDQTGGFNAFTVPAGGRSEERRVGK